MKDFFNNLNRNSNERIAIGILGVIIALLLAGPVMRAVVHHDDHHHIMIYTPGESTDSITSPPAALDPNPVDPGTIADDMNKVATETGVVAGAIIGLDENSAAVYAKQNGCNIRVGSRDGESYALTADYRPDRITVFINDGYVTEAQVG